MAWDIVYRDDTTLPLPSWVPAAGAVVSYTGGGATLTNNWAAIHDPNSVGYDPYHSRKVTNYSSRFLHPTWRSYGGMVIWGGGHSASNYNGMTILTLAASTMYFECVQSPYDWQQAALDTGSLITNSEFNTYGEAQASGVVSNPLKILGPHSYAAGAVVGGKFVQIFSSAADYLMEFQDMVAHEIDLSNPATSYNSRAWVRRTSSKGAWDWAADPICGRYVPHQGGRIYVAARGSGGPYSPQWFDLTNNTWSTGSGTGFNFPEGVAETGGLIYAEDRDLLICAYKSGGNLVLQYMSVASGVTQPTLGGTASLSASLAIPDEWGAISWCSDSNRILVFGVTGNTSKVYEIEIPGTLANTWTVDSYTLPNSATIAPATNANVGAYAVSYDYNPLTKSIIFLQDGIVESGSDTVRVYRPRGT